MSADEILAANLWPWPDPLLKRDRNGQVLFVNSAFLQLYGGRIEDWRGNLIAGWPTPAVQGAQRFETRAGETPHETVYDWVEMVMADGNAMAIARNVTALIPAPTPPADIAAPQTTDTHAPIHTPPPANTVEAALPAPEPAAPVIAPPPPAPVHEPAPAMQAKPASAEPSAPPPVAAETAAPDLSCDLENTLSRKAEDYLTEDASAQTPPQTETTALDTPVAPAPIATEPEEENSRMFERRALPIEDSTAVLGTNWRDQVIAKAVGAEAPEEDEGDEADTSNTVEAPVHEDTSSEVTAAKVGAGLRILLAEDNAINALLTRTLLENEGAIVDTVEDGALAVKAVQKEQYDLIFMDMRMPNMDGLEATRKIRALGGKHKDMPIVALTANVFDDDRNACFDSGMNDFMTKPVSAEELQEMVENWTKEEQKLAS